MTTNNGVEERFGEADNIRIDCFVKKKPFNESAEIRDHDAKKYQHLWDEIQKRPAGRQVSFEFYSFPARYRSTSMAAMQPVPAALMAWR